MNQPQTEAWVADIIHGHRLLTRVIVLDQHQFLVFNPLNGSVTFCLPLRHLKQVLGSKERHLVRLEYDVELNGVISDRFVFRPHRERDTNHIVVSLLTHSQSVNLVDPPLPEAEKVVSRFGLVTKMSDTHVFQLHSLLRVRVDARSSEMTVATPTRDRQSLGLCYPNVVHRANEESSVAYSFQQVRRVHVQPEDLAHGFHVLLDDGTVWNYQFHPTESYATQCIYLFLTWLAYDRNIQLRLNKGVHPFLEETSDHVPVELGLFGQRDA